MHVTRPVGGGLTVHTQSFCLRNTAPRVCFGACGRRMVRHANNMDSYMKLQRVAA